MTPRRILLALAVVAVLITALYFRPNSAAVADQDQEALATPPARLERAVDGTLAPANSTPVKTSAAATERSELADTLNSSAQDIRADLQVVAAVLDAFRSNFPQRGNPTGTNAEITAALTGKNALQVALIPRDHPAIDARGELCDRWGQPFFFHQLSATQMEIRSAGPDRKFWTSDDIVLSP